MKKMITAAAAVIALAGAANAQLGYSGGAYLQDFDSLPNSGTPAPWTNDTTLPGWFAFFGGATTNTVRDSTPTAQTGIRANDGTNNNGAIYSYGSTGSSERAFGSLASGSQEHSFALVLVNNTPNTYTGFNLSFVSEQWRDGGQGSFAPQEHRLVFDYNVYSLFNTADLNATNTAGYTANPNLDAVSVVSLSAASALDGNLPANQLNRSGSGAVSWGPGQYLVLRWWDNNDAGSDHGIAIDNLAFEAIPSPGALALFGLGGLVAARRRRA